MTDRRRPLPLLVSVPHGGMQQPPELDGRVALGHADLVADGDYLTDRIYDLTGAVASIHIAHVARAFVDLNRAPDDLPPANPDGAVKSATCHGIPIYRPGAEPDRTLTDQLIDRYHRPYHDAIREAVGRAGLVAAIDCHSMEPVAPPIAARPGEPRPLFCVSNGAGSTSPPAVLEQLADALAETFEVPRHEVRTNDPFLGGHLTRHHGTGAALPWIQLEMNRSLYLHDPWFDRANLVVDPDRIDELRRRVERALVTFVDGIANDHAGPAA